MNKFDPPSDPFGDEKRCPICDQLLEWNFLIKEWECNNNHDIEESEIDNSSWECLECNHRNNGMAIKCYFCDTLRVDEAQTEEENLHYYPNYGDQKD